jgi:hypothetical protein
MNEEDWVISLDKDTVLFKGISGDILDVESNDKCWFSLDQNIAYNYANSYLEKSDKSSIYVCKTSKELKLINIFSIKFKYDFWDKINLIYADNNCTDHRKIQALLPLGLPSFDIQKQLINIDFSKCDKKIDLWAQFMGGHRYSQIDFDIFMVDTIMKLYPNKYDGYIQKHNVPTCLQQSIFFPREICIFKLKNNVYDSVLIQSFTKNKGGTIKTKMTGGNIDKRYYYATFRDDYTKKDWEDVSKYIVESCGYKGSKHHLDVNYYDIMEDRNRQESEKNKKLWKKFEKYRNNPKITKI